MITEILQQYLKMVSSEGYNASVEVISYKPFMLVTTLAILMKHLQGPRKT